MPSVRPPLWIFTHSPLSDPPEASTRVLSLEQLQAAWSVAAVPVMITRLSDGQVRYANERAAQLLETSVAELTGQIIMTYYDPAEDRQQVLQDLREQGLLENRRIRGRTRAGALLVVRANLQLVQFDGEDCSLSTYQDVTEEEETNKLLIREHALLSLANSGARLSCWSWNPKTDAVWWNDYHYDLFEIPRGTRVTPSLFLERVSASDRARVAQAQRTPLTHTTSIEFELDLPSGTRRVIRDHARFLEVDGEQLILGTSQDITPDVEAQEQLAEKLKLMQMASELAKLGTWSQLEGWNEEWDPAMRHLLQVQAEEPTNFQKLMERFHPENAEEQKIRIQDADKQARAGHTVTGVYRFLMPDGTERFIRDYVSAYQKNGSSHLIGVIQDVTEAEQTRRALREGLEMRRLASEGVRLCHWHWEVERNQSWWDDLHYELFEVTLGTPISAELFLSRVHPQDRERVKAEMRRTDSDQVHQLEYELALPSGTRRVIRDYSRLLQIGGRWKVIGASLDVTADALLREALEEKLALMNLAAELAQMGFWAEREGGEEWWSDSMKELMQLKEGEPQQLSTYQNRFHPDFWRQQDQALVRADQQARRGKRSSTLYQFQLPDQSERLMRGYVGPRNDSGYLIGVVQDVTEPERQRDQLEQELELHRIANHAAQMGYFRRNLQTNETWMDDYLLQLFEMEADGWFDSDQVWDRLSPESLSRLLKARDEVVRSGKTEVELELRLPSGEQRWLRSHQQLYQEKGRHWILGVSQEVTESVKMWEVIRQNERLYAVGQLAAAVNHDLRQPLAILNIELGLMGRKLQQKPSQDLQKHVVNAHTALQHAGSIMDRSLGMTEQPRELKACCLSEVVLRTLELMETLLRKQELMPRFINHWEEASAEPQVLVQATELMLVLQNLLINARDALAARRLEVTTFGGDALQIKLQPVSAHQVRLSVVDQGVGIPEELLPEIFKPLVSTKHEHKSTGLGLAISQRIIQDHQGRIWAEPGTQGIGTAFHIELPVIRT